LQPAQLEAEQEEQPEDIECVLPSLERETPLKLEKSCSTSPDWHSGQTIPLFRDCPKTSFSNSEEHLRHRYSKMGMAASILSESTQIISELPVKLKSRVHPGAADGR